MPITRRRLLATGAAATLLPRAVRAEAWTMLEPRPASQLLGPEGSDPTEIWGFDGTVPGPEIRVAKGARVRRRLQNGLDQPTSVHWHGIRIDNAMDGVPGLTQPAVLPGETFDYDFVAKDAGTYWYHSHNQTFEQVARGLYGPLIVDEPDGPDVDHDLVLMLDDWRLDPGTMAIRDDFLHPMDLSHAGRFGNLFTVNGRFDPTVRVRRGDRLRLRLVNAANARVFEIGLNGLDGVLAALDGMPLDTPVPVTGAFSLAPAQRADLIVDATGEEGGDILSIERDGGYGLMQFDIAPGTDARRGPPVPLPPNPMPALDGLAAAPLHEMRMQGGAMAGMGEARLGNTVMRPRELAALGKFWALNGQVDRPDAPFFQSARGEVHRISFINETAFPHAMHSHGHHFREIRADGGLGPWRDTILVQPGQTRAVAMLADNLGDWLLHCHMLEHGAAGMMSWFRVV